jgi:uncharacterized protein (DUF2236 family)
MTESAFERHVVEARQRLRATGVARPGPGTISWTLNAEIVVIASWGRAVLLQLAHPLVAAAVEEHSGFRRSGSARAGRARSTIGAMLALTFGDDEAAIAAAARINVIHDRVFGRLPSTAGVFPAGEAYSAHDAELLRWVHATLLDSNLIFYDRLFRPLRADERDRYCAEAAVMEPLLDIPAGLLPSNAGELDAYLRDSFENGRIAVTARTRALARAALFPPRWQLVWPVLRPVQLMTIGWLPSAVRDAYGFSWGHREERALARWTSALRGLLRLTPAVLRTWPSSRAGAGRRHLCHDVRPSWPIEDVRS